MKWPDIGPVVIEPRMKKSCVKSSWQSRIRIEMSPPSLMLVEISSSRQRTANNGHLQGWQELKLGSDMRDSTIADFKTLMASCAVLALVIGASPASAQATDQSQAKPAASGAIESTQVGTDDDGDDIVVTGSRIRRTAKETTVPVTIIGQQALTDRGYVSAAQALNQEPSINNQLAQASGSGSTSGNGVQAPSLFGLGVGRTLTLVNGRRMVTTASGLGDAQVDSNIIPVGLLDRVEIVQGGGAAVYGSDAIAGVVNYVLRKDFQGVELDAQNSITGRGDYPIRSARVTAGTNFGGGRGNIAANVEYSDTATLAFDSRPRTQLGRLTVSNPANTSTTDGIPATRELFDARFWEFNTNGVIFKSPGPVASLLLGSQFQPDGSLATYNTGTLAGVPFASGGDGFPYSKLVGTLRTGIERVTGNVIGHYDITDALTLSTELLYAHTRAIAGNQILSNSVIGSSATGAGAIAFTRTNPFLSASTVAALSAASPSFAAGAPLFLSKAFTDLLPSSQQINTTDTYRGLLALDGKFHLGDHAFTYTVSGSYARADGSTSAWGRNVAHFNAAINPVRNSSGQIVCAINADAITTNDDPACAPINPFGNGNVSTAARNYVSARTGSSYRNEQIDILASVNGALVRLPGGDFRGALTYEHRDERVAFTPFAADAAGVFGVAPVLAQGGSYNTNEFSGELLLPIFGEKFTLPGFHALELSAAFRHVANSIAGREDVWNVGVRWEPVPGITLRGARSRNFRAPTLTQLFAPSSTSLESGNLDPCDADRISSGPNPTQRKAACLALFAANPTFGTGGPGGAAVGASAAARLATFQDSGENFQTTLVTTGGNPNLKNETSKTWNFGIVLQPRFIPGLTLSADRVMIDLTNGLSPFTTADFAAACYDDPNPPAGTCSAFTRMSTATANSQAGSFATGTTTTFNAGIIRYRGETYSLDYVFPLNRIWRGTAAKLALNIAATHTTLLESSVTGAVFVRSDGTALSPINSTPQPTWVGRLDLAYSNGPFRVTYEGYYLGPVISVPNATIETTPNPFIAANMTHSVSFQYDLGKFAFRVGVNNLTDKQPSYPTISYGDIIGRQFFAGAKVRF